MITRDEIMEFIRHENFDKTLHTLSECDKIECLITIAQSINDDLELFINASIDKWQIERF